MNKPASNAASAEGRIAFKEWHTWYKVVGAVTSEPPLVVLHGGPGIPHEYLDPLAGLAHDGRAVVFYDQLGCGDSTHLHDPSLWTVDLFVEQLDDLRRQARTRARARPRPVVGRHPRPRLRAPPPSRPRESRAGGHVAQHARLDPGDRPSPCRAPAGRPGRPRQSRGGRRPRERGVPDRTDGVLRAATSAASVRGRSTCSEPSPGWTRTPRCTPPMWGPNEFNATGTLRTWDVTGRLGEIDTPTLVICGRHDEATPALPSCCVTASQGPSCTSSSRVRTSRTWKSRRRSSPSWTSSSIASTPAADIAGRRPAIVAPRGPPLTRTVAYSRYASGRRFSSDGICARTSARRARSRSATHTPMPSYSSDSTSPHGSTIIVCP